MKKNWIKLLISLIIGGFFIWLVIKDAPVGEVFSANNQYTWENTTLIVLGPPHSGSTIVWQFDLLYIIPYFLVLTIIHVIRTLRWRDLLKPLGKTDFWTINKISSVGFMAIMLFPLRLGEFVRPYLVKTQCHIRMSAGLATIVVERVFDGLVTALLLFFCLFFIPYNNRTAENYAFIWAGSLIALGVFLGSLVLLLISYWKREFGKKIVRTTFGRVSRKLSDRLEGILDAFFNGLSSLPSKRIIFSFLFYTLVYWAINGYGLFILAKGFNMPLSLIGGYTIMSCIVVGIMIPGPPGQAGTFEYFVLAPLAVFSTMGATNLAFALICHGMQFLQQVLFGAYFIMTGKASFSGIIKSQLSGEVLENGKAL